MPSVGLLEYLIVGGFILAIALSGYLLIVLAARALPRVVPATTPPRDPAWDALRTRLANGEIDEAEFQRLRSVLQGRSAQRWTRPPSSRCE